MKYVPVAIYIACIVAANWAIQTFGIIKIPVFGLIAPAGVYFAGFTFAARNFTQGSLGRRWGFGAIFVGAALSALISDRVSLGGPLPLALASGVTFLLSETADALVWTRLRSSGLWIGAMVAGEAVAQVIDSAIFLSLAFGSIELLAGQVIGKWLTIIPVAAGMWVWRRHVKSSVLSRNASATLAGTD
jgi:uncharacterized PurR-regulated membrane protein YhhQ (DUF165 family)